MRQVLSINLLPDGGYCLSGGECGLRSKGFTPRLFHHMRIKLPESFFLTHRNAYRGHTMSRVGHQAVDGGWPCRSGRSGKIHVPVALKPFL